MTPYFDYLENDTIEMEPNFHSEDISYLQKVEYPTEYNQK